MTNEEFIKSVSLEGEIWKDVVEWEGLYIVSSFGRVATLGHKTYFTSCYDGQEITKFHTTRPRMRKIAYDANGYPVVTLRRGKEYKLLKVHRLVAMAFITNPENLTQINHKDEDKTNNKVENLEWCSSKYNSNYGTRVDRIKEKVSNAHKRGIYKEVYQKNSKGVVGISISDGSIILFDRMSQLHQYGFERHLVSHCCRKLRDDYKGYRWMFLEDYEALNQ